MSPSLLLALAILPASLGLAQDDKQPSTQPPASNRPSSEPSDRLIKQAFAGALPPDRLAALGPRATAEQLRGAMTPDQRAAARTRLAEAEAGATMPEELKELARGYLLLDQDETDQGKNLFRVAARLQEAEPDNSEGYSLAATGHHQMGDYPAAAQWAGHALKLNPNDERAQAILMLSIGRAKRGLGGVPKVEEAATPPGGMTAAGADFTVAENSDMSPVALSYARQAVTARHKGDMAGTWSNIQAAMNADPTSTKVQQLYAVAKEDQARYAETKDFLRLSREALDAGRGADAVAWARKAADRSGDPRFRQIVELTRQTSDKRAKEAAKNDLEAAAKKDAGKGLPPLTALAMTAGALLIAWAAVPQETKDHFKGVLWDQPRQELKYGALAAAIAVTGYLAWPLVSTVLATSGPSAPALTPALVGGGAAGVMPQISIGAAKAGLLAGGGALALEEGVDLVSFAKSNSGEDSSGEKSRSGSGKQSVESRVKNARLPTEGDFRYEPPKRYRPGNDLPTVKDGASKGYVDRHGNVWRVGKYHGKPGLFNIEWDVQLSEAGKRMWGQFSRGKNYINVRPDGMLSH